MAVSSDIIRTWRTPRAVMRDLLAMGQREDRAVAYLMAGCLLIFIAQWPRLSRVAFLTGDEFDRLIAYELLSWLIIWPLMMYLVAGIIHLARWVIWRNGQPWTARLALFWAVLAASPMGLLYGLMAGFLGPGTGTDLVGATWLGAMVIFAVQGLREAGQLDVA